jgi:prepilin-type N-terminal cleavage/methylation domain-containing protein
MMPNPRNHSLWDSQEPRRRWVGRRGLTMIELAAVLVILGVLAGIAGSTARQQIRLAQEQLAIQRLLSIDRELRRKAVAGGEPLSLWVDPKQVTYRAERRIERDWELWRKIDGGRDWHWEFGSTANTGLEDASRPRRILYRPDGTTSCSFAVEVAAERWLVVVGGSGAFRYESDRATRRQLLQPVRPITVRTSKISP